MLKLIWYYNFNIYFYNIITFYFTHNLYCIRRTCNITNISSTRHIAFTNKNVAGFFFLSLRNDSFHTQKKYDENILTNDCNNHRYWCTLLLVLLLLCMYVRVCMIVIRNFLGIRKQNRWKPYNVQHLRCHSNTSVPNGHRATLHTNIHEIGITRTVYIYV